MDSMRSLNTHLPRSSTHSSPPQPSAELLQAFKSAALAVTQLYKTAASDGEKEADSAWSAGYQAALDELLRFLDQEDLGLGDGEGWKVRQWATERLSAQINANDADTEPSENTQRGNSVIAEDSRQKSEDRTENAPEPGSSTVPPSSSAQPFVSSPPASSHSQAPPSSQSFDFRSQMPMPHNPDMDVDSAERSTSAPPQHPTPRSTRRKTLNRDKLQSPAVLSLGTLGQGAGVKRRLPLNEFFDISGLSSGKDWFDGAPAKKGRLS